MKDLITTAEAAKIAGITPSSLRALAARPGTKTPPPDPIRIDRRTVLWNREEVERWAETRDRKTGRAPKAD